ncbi:unnamed protein product, partial [Rotaria magnacalcarata]
MVAKNNEAANLILKREPRAAEQVRSLEEEEEDDDDDENQDRPLFPNSK